MYRLEDNIQNELTEIESGDMDWIRLVYANDKMWVLANTVMNFLVLQRTVNILAS
jgi:chorismate-pyruvate lyase